MLRISGHSASRRTAGFTFIEVLVAAGLSLIVIGGVFSAYIFLGRNLARLVNSQEQGVASRRALQRFTQDVSAAIQIATSPSPSTSQLTFTKPATSATATSDTVTYAYSSDSRTLTRTEVIVDPATSPSTTTTTTTLLSNLTAFTFNYYNASGTAVSPTSLFVKSVEFTYTSATGTASSGTQASYQMVSPRVLVRNKLALQ